MNKNILMIFTILIFTSAHTTLAFGEHIEGILTAEEFSEAINKFARDGDYVQQYVDFFITDHEWYRVYGLANGDPEKAIEIFNHSDYPFNVFDLNGQSITWIDDKRLIDPEFDVLFVHEILDYKSDQQDLGILLLIDERYANQENYDRYEELLRPIISMHLPMTFQVYQPVTNASDYEDFYFTCQRISSVSTSN